MQQELNQACDAHPTVTRRVFFKRVSAMLLGGALVLGGRFAPAASAAPRSDSTHPIGSTVPNAIPDLRSPLVRSAFLAHLGETYHVQSGTAGLIPLDLVGVHSPEHLSAHANLDTRTFENCFSVVFRGAHSMPQGTYTFNHPRMGIFPLFIVPMQIENTSFTYQAVFHRLPA